MSAVDGALIDVDLEIPRTFGGMAVYPLVRSAELGERTYSTLEPALHQSDLRITEVEGRPRVSAVAATNYGDRPVLLIDGEELIGARQNRVMNISVMVPPRSKVTIPVSCVEAGRWGDVSRPQFDASDAVMYRAARSAMAVAVGRSAEAGLGYRSDQGAIWDHIARKLDRIDAHSATSAMSAAFESRREQLDQYVQEFAAVPSQVGAVFAIAGRITGIELFDHPETLRETLPKLVRSNALDAVEESWRLSMPGPDGIRTLFSAITNADTQRQPSVGLGDRFRMTEPRLVGDALVVNDKVVHFRAFLDS